jgi:hypothetical protein
MPITIATQRGLYDCENEAVLAAVIAPLNQRGTEFARFDIEHILIDFGGCLIEGTKAIDVPNTPLCFFPHHYSLLRRAVETCQPAEGYYKIRVSRRACLSPETFAALQQYLVDYEASLLEQEASGTENLTERIAQIGQHPNIQL